MCFGARPAQQEQAKAAKPRRLVGLDREAIDHVIDPERRERVARLARRRRRHRLAPRAAVRSSPREAEPGGRRRAGVRRDRETHGIDVPRSRQTHGAARCVGDTDLLDAEIVRQAGERPDAGIAQHAHAGCEALTVPVEQEWAMALREQRPRHARRDIVSDGVHALLDPVSRRETRPGIGGEECDRHEQQRRLHARRPASWRVELPREEDAAEQGNGEQCVSPRQSACRDAAAASPGQRPGKQEHRGDDAEQTDGALAALRATVPESEDQ
jgi:hypothetical protein